MGVSINSLTEALSANPHTFRSFTYMGFATQPEAETHTLTFAHPASPEALLIWTVGNWELHEARDVAAITVLLKKGERSLQDQLSKPPDTQE